MTNFCIGAAKFVAIINMILIENTKMFSNLRFISNFSHETRTLGNLFLQKEEKRQSNLIKIEGLCGI